MTEAMKNTCQCAKIHKFTCQNHPLRHVGGSSNGGNPDADVRASIKKIKHKDSE